MLTYAEVEAMVKDNPALARQLIEELMKDYGFPAGYEKSEA